MRPKVSVNLGTNRPGGLDISLAGLANQTFQDFEVIITDGRYHVRHAQVLEAVAASGIKQPVYHVPNHRYRPDIWGTPCAGFNTGFMLSEGEFVVMLLDYAYAPPQWLEKHMEHQAKTPMVALAPHEYRTLHGAVTKDGGPLLDFHRRNLIDGVPFEEAVKTVLAQRERFREISVFSEPFVADKLDLFPAEESDMKCKMPTAPCTYHYFNTKNESFPLEAALEANGMDEHYDLGRGPGDPDLGLRLSRTGLPIWTIQEAIVHCLNPRAILPNINIVIPEDSRLPPPYQDRWYNQDGYKYLETVIVENLVRAKNPYDLRKKREEIWSWRELSQKEDAVIEKNVVADSVYWK